MPNNVVTLRATEPNDYPYLEAWWNDPSVADGCRITTDTIPRERVDAQFHGWSDTDDDHRFGRTVLDPGGMPIGHIAAWDCKDPDRDATMGILIGPYFQGLGYGNQAMKLGIGLAADQLKAKTITVKVWSFNLRARHMVESLGFKEVARKAEVVERDGHVYDEVIYRAPTATLLERIASEKVERQEGEELERQRFKSNRSADLQSIF
ncbi:GNAT family N-acetyltransferase [Bifidobacterium cebidarum]|uniref:GNAT family acetyltransferase n=1 Tax=Bifidobacterium cebidarum TaxID=2650773 RepID=A0A6I1GG02_9BIFI|nr:GNAT family N-acetyltransferase [Bifidobacterium cebidarum]KAB7788626.1 GNAT family acetyltransferase [Bifidobacterium cebidarum]